MTCNEETKFQKKEKKNIVNNAFIVCKSLQENCMPGVRILIPIKRYQLKEKF